MKKGLCLVALTVMISLCLISCGKKNQVTQAESTTATIEAPVSK